MTRVAVANAVVVNDDDGRGHGEAGGGCGQRGRPDDAEVLNELLRLERRVFRTLDALTLRRFGAHDAQHARSLSIVTWMQSGERAGRSSRRSWEPVSAEPAVRDPWFSPRASTSAGQDRHRLARPEREFSV